MENQNKNGGGREINEDRNKEIVKTKKERQTRRESGTEGET